MPLANRLAHILLLRGSLGAAPIYFGRTGPATLGPNSPRLPLPSLSVAADMGAVDCSILLFLTRWGSCEENLSGPDSQVSGKAVRITDKIEA